MNGIRRSRVFAAQWLGQNGTGESPRGKSQEAQRVNRRGPAYRVPADPDGGGGRFSRTLPG